MTTWHYTEEERLTLLEGFDKVYVSEITDKQLDIFLALKAAKPLEITMDDVVGLWVLFARATKRGDNGA